MSSPWTVCFRLGRRRFIRKSGAWDKCGHIMEHLRFNISKMNWPRGLKFHDNYILQMFTEVKKRGFLLSDLMCSHPVHLRICTKAAPGRIPVQTELTHIVITSSFLSTEYREYSSHSIVSVARSIKHVTVMYISCLHNTAFNHKSNLITPATCT